MMLFLQKIEQVPIILPHVFLLTPLTVKPYFKNLEKYPFEILVDHRSWLAIPETTCG
jgi:hypothetical protein